MNYIKLYFICVTYGLPYLSNVSFLIIFSFLFFFFLFRFFSHNFLFGFFLRFVFFFAFLFVTFLTVFFFVVFFVSFLFGFFFRFFPFLSTHTLVGIFSRFFRGKEIKSKRKYHEIVINIIHQYEHSMKYFAVKH